MCWSIYCSLSELIATFLPVGHWLADIIRAKSICGNNGNRDPCTCKRVQLTGSMAKPENLVYLCRCTTCAGEFYIGPTGGEMEIHRAHHIMCAGDTLKKRASSGENIEWPERRWHFGGNEHSNCFFTPLQF